MANLYICYRFSYLNYFFRITRSYNLIKHLKKEIKAKPNEKIHDILMKAKNDLVLDSNRIIRLVFIILAIILPLIIFYKKYDFEI